MKSIRELLQKKGLLFPTTSEEIEEVEKIYENDIKQEKPCDWNNPIAILTKGKQNVKELNFHKYDPSVDVENLSMAAREGRQISESVRKKMNEDRSNAQK